MPLSHVYKYDIIKRMFSNPEHNAVHLLNTVLELAVEKAQCRLLSDGCDQHLFFAARVSMDTNTSGMRAGIELN